MLVIAPLLLFPSSTTETPGKVTPAWSITRPVILFTLPVDFFTGVFLKMLIFFPST